jgi:3-dehydroquinate synthase
VHCYPILALYLPAHQVITLPAGESAKTLDTCQTIWHEMTRMGMDRRGVVLNLGGGVIGDMGGFAAATFKRGIDFVQVPTTLLAQVDASVGGKLGIDFMGYKNHIGVFREPVAVAMYPGFLKTLPPRELRSGFAEVIKHYLIADAPGWVGLQAFTSFESLDFEAVVAHSVEIKSRIVAADPYESGLRKALNFGHTLGHAIESYYLETPEPLLHGEAIAIGMVAEAWLAVRLGLLEQAEAEAIRAFVARVYDPVTIPESAFFNLYFRTLQDKKNHGSHVRYALIGGVGTPVLDQEADRDLVFEALRFYAGTMS